MNAERGCRLELFMCECFERKGSAQNSSKTSCKREAYLYLRGMVPFGTVPKSLVNAAKILFVHTLWKNIANMTLASHVLETLTLILLTMH